MFYVRDFNYFQVYEYDFLFFCFSNKAVDGRVGQKPYRSISDNHGKMSLDGISYPCDRYLPLFILY